jgi:hypothetical protein
MSVGPAGSFESRTVVGAPDEKVTAFVVLAQGSATGEDDLKAHCPRPDRGLQGA